MTQEALRSKLEKGLLLLFSLTGRYSVLSKKYEVVNSVIVCQVLVLLYTKMEACIKLQPSLIEHPSFV